MARISTWAMHKLQKDGIDAFKTYQTVGGEELSNWFEYLSQFEDGLRVELTFVEYANGNTTSFGGASTNDTYKKILQTIEKEALGLLKHYWLHYKDRLIWVSKLHDDPEDVEDWD